MIRLYPAEAARQLHESVQRQRRQISARAAAGLNVSERRELLRHMQDNLRDAGWSMKKPRGNGAF